MIRTLTCLLVLGSATASADDYSVDVRASTWAQLFNRMLVPGANGVMLEPETVAALYGYAFVGVQGVDVPWAKDGLSAELSAWGALGALSQPHGNAGDGDIQAAWLQQDTGPFRVRLGRQVTLPGAARYVRFDGATLGARLASFDLEAYAGFVALPRWNRPRGYYILGSIGDSLKDPALLEAQSRAGQWLLGARATWVGTPWLRASLGFHEQHDAVALAFRNLSADALLMRFDGITAGGRFVFDLAAVAPSEARLFVDVTKVEKLPFTVDYSYRAPLLLLPASSVFAAFGGASWHELGAEVSWRPDSGFRLVARAAGQLYERGLPGARASLRAQWTPDFEQRLQLIGEYGRVAAYDNGYHHLRAAARYRLADFLVASADAGLYLYDFAVRGTQLSATAFGNVEYAFRPGLRVMLSGSVATTPFAAFDAQLLGRLVWELNAPSAGGGS